MQVGGRASIANPYHLTNDNNYEASGQKTQETSAWQSEPEDFDPDLKILTKEGAEGRGETFSLFSLITPFHFLVS